MDLGVTAFALYGALLGYLAATALVRAAAGPFGYDPTSRRARRAVLALWPVAAVGLTLGLHRLAS